jgi:hypothetical protein
MRTVQGALGQTRAYNNLDTAAACKHVHSSCQLQPHASAEAFLGVFGAAGFSPVSSPSQMSSKVLYGPVSGFSHMDPSTILAFDPRNQLYGLSTGRPCHVYSVNAHSHYTPASSFAMTPSGPIRVRFPPTLPKKFDMQRIPNWVATRPVRPVHTDLSGQDLNGGTPDLLRSC